MKITIDFERRKKTEAEIWDEYLESVKLEKRTCACTGCKNKFTVEKRSNKICCDEICDEISNKQGAIIVISFMVIVFTTCIVAIILRILGYVK